VLTGRARAILDRLTARPDAGADAFFGRAVMYEVEGDLANAEAAYRRTLQLQPGHSIAANNLAMVITKRDGDLDEAMRLAGQAVRAQPKLASFYDTLAFVQHKAKQYQNSAANLRTAASLEPDNIGWRLNLIDVLIDAGENKEALAVVRDVEAMLSGMDHVSAEDRQRLDAARRKVERVPAGQTAATAP
jgi:Tfp pilus assembly protein PilF